MVFGLYRPGSDFREYLSLADLNTGTANSYIYEGNEEEGEKVQDHEEDHNGCENLS